MFGSLKQLAVGMGLWGIVLGVLVFMYSREQAEFRLLSGSEMRDVAKGAVPLPNCTTNSLINSFCNDRQATCPNLTDPPCTGTSCTGCGLNKDKVPISICNQNPNLKFTYLCNLNNPNPTGCGFYFTNATCAYANKRCYCQSININNKNPCSQPNMTLDNSGCLGQN